IAFIPRYDVVIKPTGYDHPTLRELFVGFNGVGPRTVILNEASALGFDSGFFMFKASLVREPSLWGSYSSQTLSLGLMLFVFIDDNDYPSYSRPLFLKSADQAERIGVGVVRDIRKSSVEFRICRMGLGKRLFGKTWDKDSLVTTFRGRTLDLLAQSFNKMKILKMQTVPHVGDTTALEVSTFFLPAPVRVPTDDEGRLRVEILQAIDLPLTVPMGGEEHEGEKPTFVMLKLNGKEVFRTHAKGAIHPQWDQAVELHISSTVLDNLRVCIMRYASKSSRYMLGEREINLRVLDPRMLTDQELKMDTRGVRLKLRLLFTPETDKSESEE
ncbi:hypothetical protein QBC38DRAFT_448192, partial [Podospora fimiseda]